MANSKAWLIEPPYMYIVLFFLLCNFSNVCHFTFLAYSAETWLQD